MTSKLPQEQPPVDDPIRLREWLTRLVFQINASITNMFSLDRVAKLPESVDTGLMKYFRPAIPPEIDWEGPWIHNGGEWRPMVSMVHKQEWEPGRTYYPQDVVNDGSWVMVANKETQDRPAPQQSGPPTTSLPDAPLWSTDSDTSNVYAGQIYTFTESGWVNRLRVWAQSLSASYIYSVVIVDITDPNFPITKRINLPLANLNLDDWTVIALAQQIVTPGRKILIYLDIQNTSATLNISGDWNRGLNSQNDPPSAGSWNVNNQQTVLRIDKDDLVPVDRAADLLTILTGSDIEFTDSLGRFVTYRALTNALDSGTDITWTIILIDAFGIIDQGGEFTSLSATIPTPDPVTFVEIDPHWDVNEPPWATVEGVLLFDGVDQGNPDGAYGVDVSFTPAETSEDWNFFANTVEVSGGSASFARLVSIPFGGGGKGGFEEGKYAKVANIKMNDDIGYISGYDGTLVKATMAQKAADDADIQLRINDVPQETVVVSNKQHVFNVDVPILEGDLLTLFNDGPDDLDDFVMTVFIEIDE